MLLDVYKEGYEYYLPRDDSMKSMVTLGKVSGVPELVKTAGECADRTIKAGKVRDTFFDLNSVCF